MKPVSVLVFGLVLHSGFALGGSGHWSVCRLIARSQSDSSGGLLTPLLCNFLCNSPLGCSPKQHKCSALRPSGLPAFRPSSLPAQVMADDQASALGTHGVGIDVFKLKHFTGETGTFGGWTEMEGWFRQAFCQNNSGHKSEARRALSQPAAVLAVCNCPRLGNKETHLLG